MAQQQTPSADSSDSPPGSPWQALGYLVAGVLFYGLIGWALDWWLGTTFLVAIGVLVGAGLGIYMTIARFGGISAKHSSQS
ncbi:AtpZ/AtpI family protein [Nocardioides limicola]|uniref:AtpZ/AtpI family protein n=1 Tax=Nocardioides limicola TaxID=2803368 RepID=UPI00193BCCE8|nr:hypothetical protein [Nocardioides sp. DJM-14]